ncbi:unnamed protein product [Closterium sp. Naga37s-1]|nr:unnamed protein product [Closterium sp. Naga37s-1]
MEVGFSTAACGCPSRRADAAATRPRTPHARPPRTHPPCAIRLRTMRHSPPHHAPLAPVPAMFSYSFPNRPTITSICTTMGFGVAACGCPSRRADAADPRTPRPSVLRPYAAHPSVFRPYAPRTRPQRSRPVRASAPALIRQSPLRLPSRHRECRPVYTHEDVRATPSHTQRVCLFKNLQEKGIGWVSPVAARGCPSRRADRSHWQLVNPPRVRSRPNFQSAQPLDTRTPPRVHPRVSSHCRSTLRPEAVATAETRASHTCRLHTSLMTCKEKGIGWVSPVAARGCPADVQTAATRHSSIPLVLASDQFSVHTRSSPARPTRKSSRIFPSARVHIQLLIHPRTRSRPARPRACTLKRLPVAVEQTADIRASLSHVARPPPTALVTSHDDDLHEKGVGGCLPLQPAVVQQTCRQQTHANRSRLRVRPFPVHITARRPHAPARMHPQRVFLSARVRTRPVIHPYNRSSRPPRAPARISSRVFPSQPCRQQTQARPSFSCYYCASRPARKGGWVGVSRCSPRLTSRRADRSHSPRVHIRQVIHPRTRSPPARPSVFIRVCLPIAAVRTADTRARPSLTLLALHGSRFILPSYFFLTTCKKKGVWWVSLAAARGCPGRRADSRHTRARVALRQPPPADVSLARALHRLSPLPSPIASSHQRPRLTQQTCRRQTRATQYRSSPNSFVHRP